MIELTRLLGLGALLLSFALLVVRRPQPFVYSGQSGAVALAALCQAWLQSDWQPIAVAVVLVAQAMVVWMYRPAFHGRVAFPVVTVVAALLLVVLATASAPSEGMGVPLAIVLLGLLAAAFMPGPYGVLSLLNGVVLAMVTTPELPLRPFMALALAVLGCLVASDGVLPAWVRR
jgi:hypothetical protein